MVFVVLMGVVLVNTQYYLAEVYQGLGIRQGAGTGASSQSKRSGTAYRWTKRKERCIRAPGGATDAMICVRSGVKRARDLGS